MHSWRHGLDWVIHHSNCTRPGNPVIIVKRGPLKEGHERELEEMEVPFEVLLNFVCEMLQRDAQSHMDDISPEEWLREQIGAPRR